MLGWFGHPCIFLFFQKNKICDKGIFEKKNVKVVELSQFKSLRGKMLHFKLWRQKCKSVDTSGE